MPEPDIRKTRTSRYNLVRRLALPLTTAGLLGCDDLTAPGRPDDPSAAVPVTTMASSSGAPVPGAFSVTLGVDANFVKTEPLPFMAETLMYVVKASGSVIDKRCTTTAPLVCTEPDFDAGGRWFGLNAHYGSTYISSSNAPQNIVFTRHPYNPVGVVYTRTVVLGGTGLVGRGGRDSKLCYSSSGSSQCSYHPTGSHTYEFTPTHHANRDLTVDSSLVNPGSVATFKVTNISSSSAAVTLLKWTWVPDDGAPVDLTSCPLGTVHKYASPTCAQTIYSSGTMYTRTKQLGGTIEQQDARVDVRSLSLTSNPAEVFLGDPITFRSYLGEHSASITHWRWSGDSPDEATCAGDSVCIKATVDTGTFAMTGVLLVNGDSIVATTLVLVKPPRAHLACSPEVAFYATATCTLTVPPPSTAGPTSWRFHANGGLEVTGPTGVMSWEGPMVVGGTVKVNVEMNGSVETLEASIAVTRRVWTWSALVEGKRGESGDLDPCMERYTADAEYPLFGLMLSANCVSEMDDDLFIPRRTALTAGNGYAHAVVPDGGPNSGLYFVDTATARMDLRTQVVWELRPDGPPYDMTGSQVVTGGCYAEFANFNRRNVHTVNTVCVETPEFSAFIDCVWTHESKHLAAGIASAQKPAHDIYALWEPLVARDAAALKGLVTGLYSLVHGNVQTEVLAAHDLMAYKPDRSFWAFGAAGWVSVLVEDQRC